MPVGKQNVGAAIVNPPRIGHVPPNGDPAVVNPIIKRIADHARGGWPLERSLLFYLGGRQVLRADIVTSSNRRILGKGIDVVAVRIGRNAGAAQVCRRAGTDKNTRAIGVKIRI